MKTIPFLSVLAAALSGLGTSAILHSQEQAKALPSDEEKELAIGKQIYDARCKGCHRSDGKGTMDEMNLTDDVWRHGGTPEAIDKTIREGIKGTAMRPITGDYADAEIKALVKYVLKFSADSKPPANPPEPLKPPAPPAPPPPPL